MTIISKNNPIVKELASLKDKKFRKKSGTFLVEGEKMVRECVQCGLNVIRLAVREDYVGDTYDLPVYTFGNDAFSAICDEKTPQGIAAEVQIPVCEIEKPTGNCLLLDGVSDPANLGAVIRTANAAGFHEIYCVHCADPFSPKSVRASMSGVFYAKIMRGERAEILSVLETIPLIAADMGGENVFTFHAPNRFALCIGNEGNGISDETAQKAAYTVKIPMESKTESLNAAVSAGILMYLLNKKRFE